MHRVSSQDFWELENGLNPDLELEIRAKRALQTPLSVPQRSKSAWSATIRSCFAVDPEDYESESEGDFKSSLVSFGEEPITYALIASTQVIFSTISTISNYFFGNSNPKQAETASINNNTPEPSSTVIDFEPSFVEAIATKGVESPKFISIKENSQFSELKANSKVLHALSSVESLEDGYDANGFWDESMTSSDSESIYGIDSYIDFTQDSKITQNPIPKRNCSQRKQVDFDPLLKLMDSAIINDRATIRKFIQGGQFDINVHDKLGYTLLHYASAHGHADLVKYLLENGADINQLESGGWSALHFAAIADNVKICKLLVDEGANIECPNEKEELAMDLAENAKIKKLLADSLKKKLSSKKVKALYDWDAESFEDLTIRKGHKFKVVEKYENWWLLQNDQKQTGLVPRIFVQ